MIETIILVAGSFILGAIFENFYQSHRSPSKAAREAAKANLEREQ